LHIPTGSDRIEISPNEASPSPTKDKTLFSKRSVIIALLTVGVVALGYLFFVEKENRHSFSKQPLWQDFLSGDQPTMLLLGDLFIYTEFDSALGTTRILRDTRINSRQEFDSYRGQHPEIAEGLGTLSYGLLIQSSALWIKRLTEIFHAAKKDYTIRMVSRFNPKELQDFDIMVVGMIKTLGLFRSYFANSAFRYDSADDALMVRTSVEGEATVYKPSGDPDAYHTDYAVMAKFPGPNNNTIYLFGGIWDTGATQSLKCFTDARLLETVKAEMVKTLGEVPEYYEVLLEVNGVDRMELTPKILQVYALSNLSGIWAGGN
jgi:hypothetical protein